MAVVFARDGNSVIGTLGVPEDPQPDDLASVTEVFGAAFRQNNILASLYAADRSVPLGVQDPDFDVFEHISGTPYEEYSGAFVDADTPEDVAKIRIRIDKEIQDRETVASAGWLGFGASFAAGALDPIWLLPVGGAASTVVRGARGVLKSGAAVGRAGFVAATAAEAALHTSQETRTLGESAATIAAATFLSGVAGGAVGLFTPKLRTGALREIDEVLGEGAEGVAPPPIGVIAGGSGDEIVIPKAVFDADMQGAPGLGGTATEELLKKAFGAEKLVKGLNPMMRSASSPYLETRKLVQELADTSLFYEKNALGIATPVSVESDIIAHQAPLARSLEFMNQQFVKYKTGQETSGVATQFQLGKIAFRDFRRADRAVERLDDLTFAQFRRIAGKAARRGDVFEEVPEIQAVAQKFREEVFEPLKNRAIDLELLPKDVEVETAISYLSRVWRRDQVRKNRDTLQIRTTRWLRDRHPEFDETKVSDVADDIIDRLLSLEPGRTHYDVALAGPLKGRTFVIPDEIIEDFLESDIALVGRYYTNSMAPDVELTARFGSTSMEKQIKEIRNEARERIRSVFGDTEAVDRLGKAMEDDIRDISAMRDRLRGTYKAPDDPDGLPVRAGRFLRNVNFFTVLGGVVPSSTPDMANIAMINGFNRFMGDGVRALMRNPQAFRLSANEGRLAGTAWEIVMSRRAKSLAEIGDEFGRHTPIEQFGKSIADTFPLVSGLSFWNEGSKMFASVVTSARILDTTAALKAGKAIAGDVEKLARSGIGLDDAAAITAQFSKHGRTVDGVKIANTEAWDDLAAVRVFRAALRKDVDTAILTPGVGDRPLWISTEMGSLLGQFKTFSLTATHRIALAQLQQRDAASLHGLLFATTIGMFVYAQKTLQAGKNPFAQSPIVWLKEGVDRSGATGIAMDVNNVIEKATRGTLGLSALVGGPTASRYASRNVLGAFAGPTAGRILTTAKVTGALASGEFNNSDARAVRRMIPYQNLFYLDKLFDAVEVGLKSVLVSGETKQ